MSEPELFDARLDLSIDRRAGTDRVVHRWFGRRGPMAARAAVALTAAPEIIADSSAMESLSDPKLSDICQFIPESAAEGQPAALLDLCSGTGVVSEVALRAGLATTAVDSHPISVLSCRCRLVYPPLYGAPDPTVIGRGTDGTWWGLAQEFLHWSQEVLSSTKTHAGEMWLNDDLAVRCARTALCPNPACAVRLPLHRGTGNTHTSSQFSHYAMGTVTCGACGTSFCPRAEELEGWEPISLLTDGFRSEVAVPEKLADLINRAEYPASISPRLDQTWTKRRFMEITHRTGVTPRQAIILDSFRRSIWRAKESMTLARYPPDRIAALSTYLALAASDLIEYLCTSCSVNRGRIQRALASGSWGSNIEFVEIGGETLERLWHRRTASITEIIRESSSLRRIASVKLAEMTNLEMEGELFDLIVWDPPFYDNIDYDNLAAPWATFLQSTIGDFDHGLHWRHDGSSGDKTPYGRFDTSAYEQSLSAAAAEIVRVARPRARLGVFWVSRLAEELQHFIDILQPNGLELLQTVALHAETSVDDTTSLQPTPYFLVLRVLKQAGRPEGQTIDAGRLLELASTGQATLYAGLAEIIANSLEYEEIREFLPEASSGSIGQQLAEYVADQTDLSALLRELGRSSLRRQAGILGVPREELLILDTAGLARKILSKLGFTVPTPPAFSIEAALDGADRARSRLRSASTEESITGCGRIAATEVEHALRFAIIVWCTHVKGDDWWRPMANAPSKLEKFTFGPWINWFVKIPGLFAADHDIYRDIQSAFTASGVSEILKSFLELRNEIIHPEMVADWRVLRDSLYDSLGKVIDVLRDLLGQGFLPVALQPVEETRDQFSRFRLKMIDHREREWEVFATGPSDLTTPKIILRSSAYPREIDPELLDGKLIEARMGLISDS
jgi:hypothetical protein